jgi:hypothetical protein
MGEVRIPARTLGPGAPGFVRVALVASHVPARRRLVVDVRAETLPPALRTPNAEFVAVVRGRDVLRVEPAGAVWIEIQDRIRPVLNTSWDPIRVAGVVEDEYDSYIAPIYALLRSGGSEELVMGLLASFETKSMGLNPSAPARLRTVAEELLGLTLPSVPEPDSTER